MTDSIESALSRFLSGEANLEQLQDVLNDKVRFEYLDTNEREVEILVELPTVRFGRSDIEIALRRFLRGGVKARDLSDWAATLRLLDCFELSADESDPDAVWDVVDRLASPDAWGALTTESAIEMIHRL